MLCSYRKRLALVAAVLTSSSCTIRSCRGWTSSGMSNDQLVNNLIRDGIVETENVANVLRRLDRREFAKSLAMPDVQRSEEEAYRDAPLPITDGSTISAPHMLARALELLLPVLLEKANGRILDVGSGSGYLTAALALLAGENAVAYGIEHTDTLVQFAQGNLASLSDIKLRQELKDRVHFFNSDGWLGLPDMAPFDAIHCGAAASTVPDALLSQLARGGRLIIPVGQRDAAQQLLQIDKLQDDSLRLTRLFGVRYVELVKKSNDFGY